MAVSNVLNIGASPKGWTATNTPTGTLDPDAVAHAEATKYAADAAAGAQKYGLFNQQSRFNSVFPWLQGELSNTNGALTAGGTPVQSPTISVGGVLNPSQINQQVNASRASTDQTAQTQMNQQQAKTSSQGFGSNSPLLSALQGQTRANALSTNVGNERDIRLNAAQANAGQVLQSQQAQEAQAHNRAQEDIARRVPYFQYRSSLLGALSGLVAVTLLCMVI